DIPITISDDLFFLWIRRPFFRKSTAGNPKMHDASCTQKRGSPSCIFFGCLSRSYHIFMRSYEKSRQLYERACRSMAGGVSSHFRMAGTPHPLFFTKGKGSLIYDADGNEYLDFTLSQGPMLLGHSHPEVLRQVAEETANGQLYAGQHMLELELAEKIKALVPCAELIRFSNSGSESVQASLRLARGFTGRKKYIK